MLDAFNFHITLTGPLEDAKRERWRTTALSYLPSLPRPYTIESIALVGEREDGRFELIERYALTG
ncbi:MAG: DUF1045 domain-containing protein [Pseudomonadota bacterium]